MAEGLEFLSHMQKTWRSWLLALPWPNPGYQKQKPKQLCILKPNRNKTEGHQQAMKVIKQENTSHKKLKFAKVHTACTVIRKPIRKSSEF